MYSNNYEEVYHTTTGAGDFKITNPKQLIKFFPKVENR